LINDAQENLNLQLALVKQEHVQKSYPVLNELENIRTELNVFKSNIDDILSLQSKSKELHNLSAVTLAFDKALLGYNAVKAELNSLKTVCKNDELLSSIVHSFPEEASTTGIPTASELCLQFVSIRANMRKVALAPEAAPSIVSNLVGSALAAVSWVPEGYVSGTGVEETLSRVAFLLDLGDLKGALQEIDTIKGNTRNVSSTWEASVRSRLEAEQAVKAIKAIATLRHIQLGN
jgi:hypothetical protein